MVVVANATTLVSFTGTHSSSSVTRRWPYRKVNALWGAPLAAALALVEATGTIVAACTTPEDGTCDDQSLLLPGTYKLTEISPPVGFADRMTGLPQIE